MNKIETIEQENFALSDLNNIDKPETIEENFARLVRELRALQVYIDDTATVAAIQLSRLRGIYNHKLELHKLWLSNYAKAHLPTRIDKETGETKQIKNYRSMAGGAGVFFTVKRGGIGFPQTAEFYRDLLEESGTNYSEALEEKTVVVIKNPKLLLQLLQHAQADTSAIEVVEDDEYGHMTIGAKTGWSANASKKLLTKAISGEVVEDENE